ncbi:MAG TPA: hypothetical protein VJ912_02710 [Candidatus Nanoarchaeia archaeon]|nr:hypothetical protein [Candidatus Nanoarchaeia archaeon]
MLRITCDIDSKNKLKVLFLVGKALYKVKKIKEINIKKSYSGNYHLIIWTEKKYTYKQIYDLRKKLGDDKKRIHLDQLRTIGKDTLFNKKENIMDSDVYKIFKSLK